MLFNKPLSDEILENHNVKHRNTTVVISKHKESFVESRAIIEIFKELNYNHFYGYLLRLLPVWLGDLGYKIVYTS